MAFNFLGSFTRGEVEALLEFAQAQRPDVQAKVEYLTSEIAKLGWLQFKLDPQGIPESYLVDPPGSYMASLVANYQVLGGNILDVSVRSRGQWLYFSQGDPTLDSGITTTKGQLSGVQAASDVANLHVNDSVPAITVDKVKAGIGSSVLKQKRENAEYAIRRCVDLTDQYLNEIILLVRQDPQGDEPLEALRAKIQYYLRAPDFPSSTS